MYHRRRGPQQWTQQVELALEERRVAGGLQEVILVLTNVLLGRRLPGHLVQLPVRVHVFHYASRWRRPCRQARRRDRPGTSPDVAGLLTCAFTTQDRTQPGRSL